VLSSHNVATFGRMIGVPSKPSVSCRNPQHESHRHHCYRYPRVRGTEALCRIVLPHEEKLLQNIPLVWCTSAKSQWRSDSDWATNTFQKTHTNLKETHLLKQVINSQSNKGTVKMKEKLRGLWQVYRLTAMHIFLRCSSVTRILIGYCLQ